MNRYIFSLVLTLFLLLPLLAFAEPKTIRILHVNDFHGFANPIVTPGSKSAAGGVAWLAQRIDALRSEKPSLLLAAGDMIQGDTWANLTSGTSVIEIMNLMGFDAMTTGNHEYDFGLNVLRQRIEQAAFPVLAANVTGFDALQSYTIINRGGVRVGIIGLVTEDTPQTSHPRNTVGLTFSKPLARARELIRELRTRTDLIILLTHTGHSEDLELAKSLNNELSAAPHHSMVMGNLVIIGGHSHSRIEQPAKVGSVYVSQAWEHGKNLGVLDITVDKGRITALNDRIEEITPSSGSGTPAIAATLERYNRQVAATLSHVVGEAANDLPQEGSRERETALGSLVADIVKLTASADAALINGGSVRAGIARGRITVRDIYTSLPFNNYIVAVRLSGSQLRESLEHGVSGVERGEGRFPQVSGITFEFDRRKPVGQRIGKILIHDALLDEKREYVVATLDFMAAGGDGYKAFGEAIRSAGDYSDTGGALKSGRLAYNDPSRWLRDIASDYITARKTVSAPSAGRIREIR